MTGSRHLFASIWPFLPPCSQFYCQPLIKSKKLRTENCLFEKAISICFHHSNAPLKILSTVVITCTMLSIFVVCRKSSLEWKSRTLGTYLLKKSTYFPSTGYIFHPDNTFIKGEIAINNSKPNRNQPHTKRATNLIAFWEHTANRVGEILAFSPSCAQCGRQCLGSSHYKAQGHNTPVDGTKG